MSRTKRKDPIDTEPKRPDFVSWGGYAVSRQPTQKELRRAHADGKKRNKPPSWYKRVKAAKRKAAAKQVMRTMRDPDELNLPAEPRSDCWDWS